MIIKCFYAKMSSFQAVVWFNIGSVKSFERNLDNCQKQMGVEPNDYISVIYKSETEMFVNLFYLFF